MALEADTDELTLAADFPGADHAAWLKLVEKVLNGVPFDKKLVARSYDGIAIQPLYTRDDWDATGDPSGVPGAAPFTRGGTLLGTSQGGWGVRQSHGHPDPAVANRQILDDLEHGVSSIVLKVDPAGKHGVCIRSRADLDTTLRGVMLDLAPVVLEPTGPSLPVSALVMDLLARSGVKNDAYTGNFGADPLASLAASGTLITALEIVLARMADTACHVSRTYPKARALNVKTAVYHSAGCGEAQELGFAMATAVDYLRAVTKAVRMRMALSV